MRESRQKTIIIGYGNPGRQDDGLGPECVNQLISQLSDKDKRQIHLQTNYQLTVEDAYDIVDFDQVIFIDASLNKQAPFFFTPLLETDNSGLGSHSLTPNAVIRLCETLYDKTPTAFILGIKGYEFDQFDEHLSNQANTNMLAAVKFLMDFLGEGIVDDPDRDNQQTSAHA